MNDIKRLKQYRSDIKQKVKSVLEHCIQEDRPGFELVCLSYQNSLATGYFVNPADLTYVHVWELRYDIEKKTFYADTWREVMLVPVDGYRFPRGVIPVREDDEIRKMGFYELGRHI